MSIFDHPDDVPSAPSWRCPHCRTLQPEASMCRGCARATVACGSCQLYRQSFVTGVGYCAQDGSRTPLTGEEVRSCWRDADVPPALDNGILSGARMPDAAAMSDGEGATPAEHERSDAPAATPVVAARASLPAASESGGLVEAPRVEPSRNLLIEAARRARDGRNRP